MRNLILSTLSILTLLIYPLSLSAQNSFSLSLDVDGAAGDQTVTSLNTAPDQVVALRSLAIHSECKWPCCALEYDAGQVTYGALTQVMSCPMHRHYQSRAQAMSRLAWHLWEVRQLPIAVWWARYAFAQRLRFPAQQFGWCVQNSAGEGDLRP